ERMTDRGKVDNVRRERAILQAERDAHLPDDAAVRDLTDRLRSANGRLWDLEDAIRDCERRKDFGPAFIEAARAIYRTNDERAALKKAINLHFGSLIVEEKSYAAY
ncbi:MAG TPA: hypothetical protein VFB16_03440, partial [Bauldia sp.]|nr:hypothetical protein [Bauldia sp.]